MFDSIGEIYYNNFELGEDSDYIIDRVGGYIDANGNPVSAYGKLGDIVRIKLLTRCYVSILAVTADAGIPGSYVSKCTRNVFAAFLMDHPEVFWLKNTKGSNSSFWRIESDGTRYYYLVLRS